MDGTAPSSSPSTNPPPTHRRRPRYAGRYPRRFEEKYKEHQPERYQETVAKVLASGKTPAGSHRPIMVAEILEVLAPKPGEIAVDATLGHGGHAQAILPQLLPGGRLIGIDADPVELPKTEARLRALGFGPETLTLHRSNFAGLPKVLSEAGVAGADLILADLGVSSMQLDDPSRGFSVKNDGPLDMRMNPNRGEPVSALLAHIDPDRLARWLVDHSDEPNATLLGRALAGKHHPTTQALARAIRQTLPTLSQDAQALTIRRVFQALRIAVNDEFSALETLLRHLPGVLKPGGRVAVLTFHSGEDRRVKHAFESARQSHLFSQVADTVLRPSPTERRDNPRSASAKLRWAIRA
ncbi:MAG: 16S rRNA (cytosine(1402)-N(4))-methyltransferase RsmH [Verrucomicrobiales bacterium]|nr:16S rRNA (cytosine(1402)-N(4))-methyltransferase RsmH [Verrucomicrobiales bacterium]